MRTLRLFALVLVCAALTAIILRWISLERWRLTLAENVEEEPVRIIEPTPPPTPTPPKTQVIGGKLETSRLFSGITVNATVEPTPGGPASDERLDPQSYVLDLKLHARVPTPNKTIEELAKVNPELPRLLPALADDGETGLRFALLQRALRDENQAPARESHPPRPAALAAQLLRLPDDLQLQHPETKRKAVLMQAEMDVDADGSDSDRLPAGSGVSTHFQPYTSYRWAKKTSNPSAYLPMLEERIKTHEAEANQKGDQRGAQSGAEERDRQRARWHRSAEEVQFPHRRDGSVYRHNRRVYEKRRRESWRLRGRHRRRQNLPRARRRCGSDRQGGRGVAAHREGDQRRLVDPITAR